MSLAIVVEYQIQNDEGEIVRNRSKGQNGQAIGQPAYPNMYILPKRYGNISEVKIADVIRAFPMQSLGSDGKVMNPSRGQSQDPYSNLHFRFETVIFSASSQKKIVAYKDIVCNNQNLVELQSIPAPHHKDQIRVKVLKMPNNHNVKKQLPRLNKSELTQIYRNELGVKMPSANTLNKDEVKSSGGLLAGLIGGGAASQGQDAGQSYYQNMPNVNTENVREMASTGYNKLSGVAGNASEKLQGVFSRFNTSVFGTQTMDQTMEENQRRAKELNFSDDEDQEPEVENSSAAKYQEQQDQAAEQQEYNDYQEALRRDAETQKQAQQQKSDYNPPQQTNLFDGFNYDDPNPSTSTYDPQFGYQQPSQQQQNTNLLFSDGPSQPSQPAPQKQFDTQKSQYGNIFDDSAFTEPSQAQPSQSQQQNDLLGSGLDGLNFADFSEEKKQQAPQQQQQPAQIPNQSRGAAVKEFFNEEQKKRDAWDNSADRLSEKIDNWMGQPGNGLPPGAPGFVGPRKNHIKVLLCTLHTVMWQGNKWGVVGMDKLTQPNQVKKFYRKAMMMCHPDKVTRESEPDKIYISNRCFAALNDAFNDYKNEPGVNI